jgi:hypothetical protein
MRPISKGSWPTKGSRGVAKRVFNSWQRAIPHLVGRTGPFCHLCEMRVTNALAIEHILPKVHYPRLSAHWANFLLICNYCNSHKVAAIPRSPYKKTYFWPHLNNTLKVFYVNSVPEIVPNKRYLTGNNIIRAQNTINLYGLNKTHNAEGESDNRWTERAKAMYFAIKRLNEFNSGVNSSVDNIIEFAETTGFFSVWLKIFDNVPAVRAALINHPNFYLASTNCFDPTLQLQNRTSSDF